MKNNFQQSGPTVPGVHLWLLLWKASKAVEGDARRSVTATGMCLSDFGILEALLHKGPLPVNVLGTKLLLTSGSMTAAVDRLEREGLVQRNASQTDRRARIVSLTAVGKSRIQRVFAEHQRDLEQTFQCLSGTERETLAALLRKVGHQMESPAENVAEPTGKATRHRGRQTRGDAK